MGKKQIAILCGCMILNSALADGEIEQSGTAVSKVENTDDGKRSDEKLIQFLKSNKDPFGTEASGRSNDSGINAQYQGSSADDMIVLDSMGLPPGINVQGIIIDNEGHEFVALSLPGHKQPVLMQKNESVRLSHEQLATAGIERKTDIYIRLIGIEKSGVKIIQERRPDQVIILR